VVAQPSEHVLRHESARLLAALTRIFGVENLALAEDVVQDTLAKAIEAWTFSGVPEHYSALLMTAAKHRAIDLLRRERTARRFAPELGRWIESEWTLRPVMEEHFLPPALKDDELRMMFSCCHPKLDEEVQLSLILKLLCGFGVREIASAFLITVAAVEKRISRGKKVLADSSKLFELTAADFAPRLSTVHRALYLLFNEGYHGACADRVIRTDLCQEAIRLVRLLVDHAPAATPATYALAALMHLDAARLPGRLDATGNLVALFEQDRSRWDAALISEGLKLLEQSATGAEVTEYHLESGIAAAHAAAGRAQETRWAEIVALYDALMKVRPSPVVALNRAVAVAQHAGPSQGLEAIRSIEEPTRLASYPFYWAAIAELELRAGNPDAARDHFATARGLARNEEERRFLEQRIAACYLSMA
jgi:RNA polymerase sigma-70 factor (ECF subfamily)